MKNVFSALIALSISTSPVYAQNIPIEGWIKSNGIKFGDSWLDSGKRNHFFSATGWGEMTLYGEGFGFKGKSEAD